MRQYFQIAVTLALLVIACKPCIASTDATDPRPNVLVILVDDQDYRLHSLDHMQSVQSQLIQQGTLFTKHYGHVSECCPSRATLWTGKHAHNTNVTATDNDMPGGAWKQLSSKGWQRKYLPVWMQQAGYQTYYSGKIFNGYGIDNYCDNGCLEGWTKADLLAEPHMYTYYNSSWVSYNGNSWTPHKIIPGYSTDQISDNVADFIGSAAAAGAPFFAVAGTVACHFAMDATYNYNKTHLKYPKPKDKYLGLYPDLQAPRTPNFNPENRTGVNVVWNLTRLDDESVYALDELYRYRQRALRSVEDLVDNLVHKLTESGVLDNTYIIYTSDNGYHIGQHRLQGGKLQCFEEDVNIPFIIRGPDVGKNQISNLTTGHIDLAPTILGIAGVNPDPAWELDGTAISFPLKSEIDYQRNVQSRGESTHIEFWGPFYQEGQFSHIAVNLHAHLNIYKAVRVQGEGYNLMYSVWCQDGSHELYDMSWDQYQMTNLHPNAPTDGYALNPYNGGMKTLLGRSTDQVINRLDALVLVQKSCSADTCREPWKQLHPDGKVRNLMNALDQKYDGFYTNSYSVAPVGWLQCMNGLVPGNSSTLYIVENEQPMWQNATVKAAVMKGAASGADLFNSGTVWLASVAFLLMIAFAL